MFNPLFVLLFLALAPATAFAQEAPDHFLYVCDPKLSWVHLSVANEQTESEFASQEKLRRVTERISFAKLIQYTPEDDRGNVYRKGSSTLTRKCGPFTITIRGGFLNGNLNGELGAIEFPLVDVAFDGKQKLSPISLGECDSDLGRFSHMTACPKDWATEVTAMVSDTNKKQSPIFFLKHTFSEVRRVP